MKKVKRSLFVILPCYDEEENVEILVKEIDRTCSHMNYFIVAVDDGSKDQTVHILTRLQRSFPIILLKHPKNLGLQEALRTGLNKVVKTAKHNDAIVTMDADLTHNPSDISVMVSSLNRNSDVVIASRYIEGGKQIGVPFHRRTLSKGIIPLSKLLFRLPVKDVTSGYRCYKADVLNKIVEKYGPDFIKSKGFEVTFELLIKAYRVGAKITETPCILDYSRKKSRSKLKILPTIFNYLGLMWRLRRS